MRIAIVSGPQFTIPPQKYGGAEQVIHHLIRGLLELGHEPILLGPGDSKVDCELIPITDKAILLPKTKRQLPAYEAKLKQISSTMRQKLRNLLPRIDVIHSHGFDMQPFRDFPNVTTIHNRFILDDLPYFQRRKELLYISISKNQQAAFPGLSYVSAIYNGQDPNDFPYNPKPDNYLCFLGRFDRDKSPHLAIQLAISLNMKIKVAGKIDYDSDSYFKEEIAGYLMHPLVEYVGEIGMEEKVKLLAGAKCNLHPTGFREPFGLTVIEAAYCGTPTLAIRRGSMPELIENGRTGILVEDFIEGYHKVRDCFSLDRSYVAKRARHLFNYKVMSQGYVDAYQKVLELFQAQKDQRDIIRSLTLTTQTSKLGR